MLRRRRPLTETFDPGDRAGTYLKPIVRTARGDNAGGALVVLERAGDDGVFAELDARLRAERRRAIFTPPIFAEDAVRGTTNPLFALRALREFVSLCLQFGAFRRLGR